jgi:hypothetical protein
MNKTQLLNSHNKLTRCNGSLFRIIVHKLGSLVLADAENVKTGERINLMSSRSGLCKSLRFNIERGLVS